MAKLIIQMYDRTVTVEFNNDDVTASQMVDSFVAAMQAQTFHLCTINKAIKEYAECIEET